MAQCLAEEKIDVLLERAPSRRAAGLARKRGPPRGHSGPRKGVGAFLGDGR